MLPIDPMGFMGVMKTMRQALNAVIRIHSSAIFVDLEFKRLRFFACPQVHRQGIWCRHDVVCLKVCADFTGGGFGSVAAVDQVHLTAGSEISANCAGGGFA